MSEDELLLRSASNNGSSDSEFFLRRGIVWRTVRQDMGGRHEADTIPRAPLPLPLIMLPQKWSRKCTTLHSCVVPQRVIATPDHIILAGDTPQLAGPSLPPTILLVRNFRRLLLSTRFIVADTRRTRCFQRREETNAAVHSTQRDNMRGLGLR